MIKRIYFFFCILIGLSLCQSDVVLAQTRELKLIDSLSKIVDLNNTDTSNIRNICRLSSASFVIQYDKGIELGQIAWELSKKINNKTLEASALEAIGSNYWGKSNFSEALRYQTMALDIYRSLKDFRGMVRTIMSISSNSFAQGQYIEAEKFYLQALDITEKKLNDPVLKAGNNGILQCMAMTYMAMGKKEQTMLVLRQAEEILIKNNLPLHRIGVFSLMGYELSKQNKTDSAMMILKKALQLAIGLNDYYWCGKIEDQMSFIERDRSNYDQSIVHSTNAMNFYVRCQIAGHVAKSKGDIGATILEALKKKKPLQISNPLEKAIDHLEEAIRLAKPISHFFRLKEYEEQLSNAYVMKGDYKKALDSYIMFRNYQDSINNITREKEFVRQLLQLEFNKKSDSLQSTKRLDSIRLKNLEQSNEIKSAHIGQLWLYFIMAFLLLGSISWMAYQKKRNRIRALNLQLKEEIIAKQKEENVLQKKINDLSIQALQMQLNPHFVFNCLNSIKLYIEENKKDDASYFLTSFSTLIRKMLDATTKETHSISEELDIIRLYLEMESMRLKEKLSWELNCDPSTEPDLVSIPTLLLQPIVENSIWHGLMPVQHGGRVGILISKKDHTIEIEIKDSGIGLYQSKKNKSAHNELHASKGLEIVEERLRYFEKKYNKQCRFHMEDLSESDIENLTGTRVLILIESI